MRLLIALVSGVVAMVVTGGSSIAQDQVDSLNQLLNEVSLPDSTLMDIHIQLAWEQRKAQSERAKSHAQKALSLARTMQDTAGQCTALNLLGIVAKNKGQYQEAEQAYLEALELEKATQSIRGIGRAYFQLANLYKHQGKYREAISNAVESLRLMRQTKDQAAIAKVLNTLGALEMNAGHYEQAVQHYQESLLIREQLHDIEGLASTYQNLGNLYDLLDDLVEAKKYHLLSLKLNEELGDQLGVADACNNLGNIAMHINELKQAKQYYQRSILIKTQLEDVFGLAGTYLNMARIHQSEGATQKAIAAYEESLEVYQMLGDRRGEIAVQEFVGYFYAQQHRDQEALMRFKTAIKLAKSEALNVELSGLYFATSRAFAELQLFDSAYHYQVLHTALKDSLSHQQQLAQFSQRDFEKERSKVELLQRDALIKDALLREEELAKNNRTYLIYLILTIAGLTIAILLAWFRSKQHKQRLEIANKNQEIAFQQMEDRIKKQEIRFADSVIQAQDEERKKIAGELHDRLGASLAHIIYTLQAVEEEMDESETGSVRQFSLAMGLLEKACDEVREISHKMASEDLEKYGLVVELEELTSSISAANRINMEFKSYGFSGRLPLAFERTVYGIIRELSTNIIKHSFATEATVGITRHNGDINIMVDDNGIGFDHEKAMKQGGIGLSRVQQAVTNLHGEFAVDSGKGQGTQICIDLKITE